MAAMDVGTMSADQIRELDDHIKRVVDPVMEEKLAGAGYLIKDKFDVLVGEAMKLNAQMEIAQAFATQMQIDMNEAKAFANEVIKENTKMKTILEENNEK